MISAGTNRPRPVGVGNVRHEHRRLARIAFLLARIGHRGLALEAIPRDAGDRVHARAHLVEHLARMRVIPVQAHAARQLVDDPEIRPGLAGRLDGLAAELHHAIGVRDGADLLGPRGRRQHHVGEIRRLGQEDVLHDQMVERGEGLAGVIDVGIGHRRVFAHDVHAADLVLLGGVDDFDDRETGLGVELHAPQFLEALLRLPAWPRADSRGRTSESVPRRMRPARCSGRAADAARNRACRSDRWTAPARSGTARCRCRARVERCPSPT